MQLNPKRPPGRVNRKARAFEHEILRLRSEGYTCEAIRLALADIGVDVSLSTVQREAARSSRQRSPIVPREASLVSRSDAPATSIAPARVSLGLVDHPRSGKEIAADFVSKRYTNPLLRDRNSHESRSH